MILLIQSAEEFVELRSSSDPAMYSRAAHDQAPLEVWREVIARHPDLRFWVAQNKTVQLEILAFLAGDPDRRVRSMVARKRSLTAEILERMSFDDDESVRYSVACHRNTPLAVLERLAEDPWSVVRDRARTRLADRRSRGEPGVGSS